MFKIIMRIQINEDDQYLPLYEHIETVEEAETYSEASKVLINLIDERELIKLIKNKDKGEKL